MGSRGRVAPVVGGLRQPRKARWLLRRLGDEYQLAALRPAEKCPRNSSGQDKENCRLQHLAAVLSLNDQMFQKVMQNSLKVAQLQPCAVSLQIA